MNKAVNVVSFDVPFPADYGGVIDVFYKLKALKESGYDVILHCFEYNRGPQQELKEYCSKVYYYQRNFSTSFLSAKPFIIKSRENKLLLKNLLKNDFPIIFEGIHTTSYVNHPKLKARKKIIRVHNIESKYYQHLAQSETSRLKKFYFSSEAKKLKRYEKKYLALADVLLPLNLNELEVLKAELPEKNIVFIPPFTAFKTVQSLPGKGDYILYHGNLSVNENAKAAEFIIKQISEFKGKLVIAGKAPSAQLKNLCIESKVKLVENPSDQHMQDLIKNAHINLLVTFQATGTKLKLFNALFNGRFCVVNQEMIEGTGLKEHCLVNTDPAKLNDLLKGLMSQEFSNEDIQKRKNLEHLFTDASKKLLSII